AMQQSLGQFTTVIDVPPQPNKGDFFSIGSDMQLNLGDGGAIGSNFRAGVSDGSSTNIEVNVTGGTIGQNFRAYAGTTVNMSGGEVDDDFLVEGAVLNLTGG